MKYVIINYDAGNVFNGTEIVGPFPDEDTAKAWTEKSIVDDHDGDLNEFTWEFGHDGDDPQCYEGDGEKECLVFTITDLVAP